MDNVADRHPPARATQQYTSPGLRGAGDGCGGDGLVTNGGGGEGEGGEWSGSGGSIPGGGGEGLGGGGRCAAASELRSTMNWQTIAGDMVLPHMDGG